MIQRAHPFPNGFTKEGPWDEFLSEKLTRIDPLGVECVLEPGVNFFVLALEKAGAVTDWSCEGHPKGFYVIFGAPLELARRINNIGFFRVSMAKTLSRPEGWQIDIEGTEKGLANDYGEFTNSERIDTLRMAAEYWKKAGLHP